MAPSRPSPAGIDGVLCLGCLGHIVKNYPVGDLPDLGICVYDNPASTRCSFCSAATRKDSCLPIPPAMLKDYEVLVQTHGWLWDEVAGMTRAADGVESDTPRDRALRRAAGVAFRDLIHSFFASMTAHHTDMGVTGAKKLSARARREYRDLVQGRRELLVAAAGVRPGDGNVLAQSRWDKAVVPGLEPGDIGYASWAAAQELCRGTIRSALDVYFGNAAFAAELRHGVMLGSCLRGREDPPLGALPGTSVPATPAASAPASPPTSSSSSSSSSDDSN